MLPLFRIVSSVLAVGLAYLYIRTPSEQGLLPSLRPHFQQLTVLEQDTVHCPEHFYPNSEYTTLEHGETHYNLLGPEDGRRIVLVHGIQWPSPIYTEQVGYLVEHGYRVLIYDLYGRGYSEAPAVHNNVTLFVEQLRQLLDHVGWAQATLSGLSMGGGIVTAFTEVYPERVERLIMIAPAGLINVRMADGHIKPASTYQPVSFFEAANLPTIAGNALYRCILRGLGVVASNVARWLVFIRKLRGMPYRMEDVVLYQLAYHPGIVRSVLFSLRDFPFSTMVENYRAVGQLPRRVPVLVVWGTADTVVPYSGAPVLQHLIPHAELITIEDAGHDLIVTHADQVSTAMHRFLSA